MKLVAIAALVLVGSFALALAVGCHSEPRPATPQSVVVIVDGGIPDAPGPKGADNSLGFPGTNQH